MTRLTPQYSANRTVREYTANHYVPAAAAFAARTANKWERGCRPGVVAAEDCHRLERHLHGAVYGEEQCRPAGV